MNAAAESPLPVISREPGRITFRVDDVEMVSSRLPVGPVYKALARKVERKVIAGSANVKVINEESDPQYPYHFLHPLVHAVHTAFNEHRPLELSPDDFALTAIQGVAHHIECNAESLRTRLVNHDGRDLIVVKTDRFETVKDWQVIIDALSERLKGLVNPEIAGSLRCDYSTTTPAIRIAAEIAMLQAFNRYFDFMVVGICGIPEITLRGTPDDWQALRWRVEKLASLDLEWWTCRLLPIIDELLKTSLGSPEPAFWRAICKPFQAYGTSVLTGWLTDLFPYLRGAVHSRPTRRNPALQLAREQWALVQEGDANPFSMNGIAPSSFPSGLAETAFRFTTPSTSERTCSLTGGFLGVEQTDTGSLRAHIGWAVTEPDHGAALLDRIAAECVCIPRKETEGYHRPPDGPAFLQALHARYEYIILFPGDRKREWEIGFRGQAEYVDGSYRTTTDILGVCPDGRALMGGFFQTTEGNVWLAFCGKLSDVSLLQTEIIQYSAKGPTLTKARRLFQDFEGVVRYLMDHDGKLPRPRRKKKEAQPEATEPPAQA